MNKLKSRKLWMALAGSLGTLLTEWGTTGTVSEKGLGIAGAIVVAYLVSQGYADKS